MRSPAHLDHVWISVVEEQWEHQRRRFTPRQKAQLLVAVRELPDGHSDLPTAPLYAAMTPAELEQRLLEGDSEAGWEIAARTAWDPDIYDE